MVSSSFPLTIVSPAKTIFSGEATLVEIPGSEGDFGVLPGHAPFFSMLRPGVITIHDGVSKTRLFTSGGYADVSDAGTTVLSDDIHDLSALSMEDALAAVEKATDLSLNAESVTERDCAHKQREAAQALVQALKAA